LREDRRHIQDGDVLRMREGISVPLNLEMAAADEIVRIACEVVPRTATLVPERREELTTEGGLDVAGELSSLRPVIARLKEAGIAVSLFIDPDDSQVDASGEAGADTIELHTGSFCDAVENGARITELERLMRAASHAKKSGLRVCAGHGINYENASEIARALPQVVEYNIGHAIIARALSVGMEEAVREMKLLIQG
jgi:pyridoxine 5-phosphate synthase